MSEGRLEVVGFLHVVRGEVELDQSQWAYLQTHLIGLCLTSMTSSRQLQYAYLRAVQKPPSAEKPSMLTRDTSTQSVAVSIHTSRKVAYRMALVSSMVV